MLRHAFVLPALVAPAIAFAGFSVEGETVDPIQEISAAVTVGPAMETPQRAATLMPATPATELPASRAIDSATHGLTVTREGQTLLLTFTTAPTKLFIEDPTNGATVSHAEWISNTNLRIAIGPMLQVQIRSQAGTLTVGVKGDGLVRIVDERAPA